MRMVNRRLENGLAVVIGNPSSDERVFGYSSASRLSQRYPYEFSLTFY
jgi:hypothetical protein